MAMGVDVSDAAAWRDYWAGDSDNSQALGGREAQRLHADWRAFFSEMLPSNGAVIEIASGTGSVLRTVADLTPNRQLLALDISFDAVALAQRSLAEVRGVVCSADAAPLASGCAAVIVSQFGLEYAGRAAFSEAARLMAPGGHFRAVAHLAGGAIEDECAANARLLEKVERSGVYAAAHRALEATFALRGKGHERATGADLEKAFGASIQIAMRDVADAPDIPARASLQRFLQDLGRLSQRRLAFDERDALGWIDGMRGSLSAYRLRMTSMSAAALSDADARDIAGIFAAAGFDNFSAAPLAFRNDRAAAWVISASGR